MPVKASSPRLYVRLGAALALASLALVAAHAVAIWRGAAQPAAAPASSWAGIQPALAAPPDGEQLYLGRCMSCHQVNGQGVPGVFPPLDGSEWVTGDEGRLVRIVLHGMTEAVTVKGVVYNSAMPPWGPFLKDDEIAAILTYTRSAWSNEAGAVTADDVSKVRAATAARKMPWTAAELQEKVNQGIPE